MGSSMFSHGRVPPIGNLLNSEGIFRLLYHNLWAQEETFWVADGRDRQEGITENGKRRRGRGGRQDTVENGARTPRVTNRAMVPFPLRCDLTNTALVSACAQSLQKNRDLLP